MKYSFKWILVGLTVVVINACSSQFTNNNNDCIIGSGATITQEKTFTDAIQKIYSGISGNVFITQGNEQKVTIQAQENIINKLNIQVVNQELRIEFENNVCISNATVNIFVTIPTIQRVFMAGSGEITGQNLWTSPNLELILAGSGNISAEIESTEVNSSLEGSGKIILKGNTGSQTINLTGSGEYKAFDLLSNQATVKLTGSGGVEVQATQNLRVTIEGSGNVMYKGTPAISQSISGSGKLIKAD